MLSAFSDQQNVYIELRLRSLEETYMSPTLLNQKDEISGVEDMYV